MLHMGIHEVHPITYDGTAIKSTPPITNMEPQEW